MDEPKKGEGRRRGYRHRENCECGLCRRKQSGQAKLTVRHSGGQLRRKKFVRAFADPNSPTFANGRSSAMAAGFAESGASGTAARLLEEPEVRDSVLRAQEGIGVDADYLSRKLKHALNAKEVRFFSSEGIVTDQREVSDNHTRLKALELAHRLRGDFPKDEPVQLASLILKIGHGPATPEEWEVIAAREQARKVGPDREGGPDDDGQ